MSDFTVMYLEPLKADPEKVKELAKPFAVDDDKMQDFMANKATIDVPDAENGEKQHLIVLGALSIFARGFILEDTEELKPHVTAYRKGWYTDYALYVANTAIATRCLLPEGAKDTVMTSIRPAEKTL